MSIDRAIFDKTIDSLQMTIRSSNALKSRFGQTVYVRELAMLSEKDLRIAMRSYHKLPGVILSDIKDALENEGLSLGMSWSVMPQSVHKIVRNPRAMLAHKI